MKQKTMTNKRIACLLVFIFTILYMLFHLHFVHVNDTVCMELSSTQKEILQQQCREIYNNSKVNHTNKDKCYMIP